MNILVGTARDRLLAATRQVIAEHGIAGTTSRTITSTAGENLASITYYFGSKDALVATALVAHVRELIEPVLTELTTESPLPHKLQRCIGLLGALFSTHRAELGVYVECLARAGRDEEVGGEVGSLFEQVTRAIGGEITRQQTIGAIPAWVDPEPMARMIVSLINGVILGSVADPNLTAATALAIGQQFAALAIAASQPA